MAFIAIGGSLLDTFGSSRWQQTIDRPVSEEAASQLEMMRGMIEARFLEDLPDDPDQTITHVRGALLEEFLTQRGTLDSTEERLAAEAEYQRKLQSLESLELCGPFEAASRSAGIGLSRFVEGVLTIQPGEAPALDHHLRDPRDAVVPTTGHDPARPADRILFRALRWRDRPTRCARA